LPFTRKDSRRQIAWLKRGADAEDSTAQTAYIQQAGGFFAARSLLVKHVCMLLQTSFSA